jgi:hypothetical protein
MSTEYPFLQSLHSDSKLNRRTSSYTPQQRVAFWQRKGAQALTMADQITPRQCVAVRAMARLAQIDAEAESIKLFKVGYEQLNRSAASALIDWLKEM